MASKMAVEELIETIKQHSILYDNTHTGKDLKNVTWEKVAKKYNVNVQVLKLKWKNLRDAYKKHLRALSGDSKVVEGYKNWQWAEYLDFLRPYLINNSNKEIAYCDENDDSIHVHESPENFIEIKMEQDNNFTSDPEIMECLVKQKPKPRKRRKNASPNIASDSEQTESFIEQPNCLQKRIRVSNPNETNEKSEHSNIGIDNFDGTDLIFLGYAKIVKNMPVKRQISTKLKIAKIMMEEELECVEED